MRAYGLGMKVQGEFEDRLARLEFRVVRFSASGSGFKG